MSSVEQIEVLAPTALGTPSHEGFLWVLDRTHGLRVSPRVEQLGLDLAYHGG